MHPRQDWLGLTDRVCVVTGGASGIGAAIAHSLVDVGARVGILDLNGDGCEKIVRELSGKGGEAIGMACDTTDESRVAEAAERVREALGDCYALVNNAGVLRSARLDDVSLDDWTQVLSVDLNGYLICARTFARQMENAGTGSLINIASIAAKFPQTGSGAYSASKAGVLLLSRQMAVEWGPRGIRSNAICPGMIKTPLTAAFYREPSVERARAAMTASGRVGEPEDIANAVLFLASPRSAYVNAAELLVDGGMGSMLMDQVPRPGFNETAM